LVFGQEIKEKQVNEGRLEELRGRGEQES